MSLPFPHGPLSDRPSETNYDLHGRRHRPFFDDFPRRVRAFFGSLAVFDTKRGKFLHETRILPQLYVPHADVRMDLLENSDRSTHCHFKGDASYRSIRVGDHRASEPAWAYAESADLPWRRNDAALEWNRMNYRSMRSTSICTTPTTVSMCDSRAGYEQENFLGHRGTRCTRRHSIIVHQ